MRRLCDVKTALGNFNFMYCCGGGVATGRIDPTLLLP